jgi:hypothetical protein
MLHSPRSRHNTKLLVAALVAVPSMHPTECGCELRRTLWRRAARTPPIGLPPSFCACSTVVSFIYGQSSCCSNPYATQLNWSHAQRSSTHTRFTAIRLSRMGPSGMLTQLSAGAFISFMNFGLHAILTGLVVVLTNHVAGATDDLHVFFRVSALLLVTVAALMIAHVMEIVSGQYS